MKRAISDEALTVIRRSTISDKAVTLPPGQLERKLYVEVNRVLADHGGKWNKSSKSHLFTDDPRKALADVLETGKSESHQQVTQAFYTPPDLADEMIDMANVFSSMKVLEPSAGRGAIADKLKLITDEVYCVETDPRSVQVLRMAGHQVYPGCFEKQYEPMEHHGIEAFDRIIMNPPFTKTQAERHIIRAFDLLKPGGSLVAIAPSGVRHKTHKDTMRLRGLISDYGFMRDLPEKTFTQSGTNVNTVIIVIKKPENYK